MDVIRLSLLRNRAATRLAPDGLQSGVWRGMMSNIKEWLLEAETFYGEQIEAIVVGKHDSRSWSHDPKMPDENIVLSREAGLAKLDEEYDSGFGGADCYPMFAWTATRVFFIHEYDGATGMNYVPRNPVVCEPQFGGRDISFDEVERIVAARKAANA